MKTDIELNLNNKRDAAIDILKFIAVLLITWSHFDEPLGKYCALATGGNFGNTLFFFISGYTLLLSKRNTSFFNWYKRRINRIYPTVFAWAIITALLFGNHQDIIHIMLYGGGAFVTTIMICYVFFYPIKTYVPIRYWGWILVIYLVFQGGMWFLIDRESLLIHRAWIDSSYFLSMLIGALAGYFYKKGKLYIITSYNKYVLVFMLLLCVVSYYVLMYVENRWFEPLEIVNIIPLIGFAVSLYALCSRLKVINMFNKPWPYWLVRFIGGLCLEVYIVQPFIISDKLNNIFPLNLLVLFVAIIIASYSLRIFGRVWSQTFKEDDYNWKEIIKPF